MCRGANLGTCCAQGCDDPITCQDTGGYCNAHDPNCWEDPAPPVADDPEKRRTYTRSRLTIGITRLEASIRADEKRLVDYRDRLAALPPESEGQR